MKAVVVDPNVAGRLVLADVPDPTPGRSEAVVQVSAISLNRGETRSAMNAAAGARPGWDLAGVVTAAAADGSGPKVGQHVVGIVASTAWAQQVAVPANQLGVLPDNVTFEQASTLPVAGMTALYALEKGQALLGRKVMITGASGGVGLFAIELAADAGAEVTAVVRQDRHADLLKQAGATNVVVDGTAAAAAEHGPFNVILESVGGASLSNSLTMLAFGGVCVLFGASSEGTGTIDIARFFRAGRVSLYGFGLFNEFGIVPASAGLTRIAALVGSGRLHPLISVTAPWTDIASVAQRLLDRDYPGKAVLTVS